MTGLRDDPRYGMFPNKNLYRLVMPLVIEQAALVIVGLVDAVMLSSIDHDAFSAISLVDMINNLISQIFMAIGAGGAIVAAQYIGKKDRKSAVSIATQAGLLAIAVSLSLMLAALALNDPLLRMLYPKVNSGIMGYSRIYFALVAVSYPFYALYSCGCNLLYAQSNSRASMISSFTMYLSKVLMNLLFISVFKMGVWGIGLSTILSRAIGAFMTTHVLLHPDSLIHYERPFSPRLLLNIDRRMIRVAWPAAAENSLFLLGKLVVGMMIAGLSGVMIAANSAANTISTIVNVPTNALSLATITVVGQCAGARMMKEARYNAMRLLKLTYIAHFFMSASLFALTVPLVAMLKLPAESSQTAIDLLRVYFCLTFVFEPGAFGLPNSLRASGDNKYTMYVSIFSMVVFRVGFSFLFTQVLNLGIHGVWYAMYIDWAVRTALFIRRYRSGKWERHILV